MQNQQKNPFPKIQRLNEDVESNAQAALTMASKNKPVQPFAVTYNIAYGNNKQGGDDTKSVLSDVGSRRSTAAGSIRPYKDNDTFSTKIQDPIQYVDENGNPIQQAQDEEEDEGDEKGELYDEINSLYNLETPKSNADYEDDDEKRSQYTQ